MQENHISVQSGSVADGREADWIRPSVVEGIGLDKMNNTNKFKQERCEENKAVERLFGANDFLIECGKPMSHGYLK